MGLDAIPVQFSPEAAEHDQDFEPVEVSAAVFIGNQLVELEEYDIIDDLEINSSDEQEHFAEQFYPEPPPSVPIQYGSEDDWLPYEVSHLTYNPIHFIDAYTYNMMLENYYNEKMKLIKIRHMQLEEFKYSGVDFDEESAIWTKRQKAAMRKEMRLMSLENRKKKIIDRIESLNQRYIALVPGPTEESKIAVENIQFLLSKMLQLDTRSLQDLAYPLYDDVYNWDRVSDAMNNAHTPLECMEFWHVKLHPWLNKKPWSKAENKKLSELATAHNFHDWNKITQLLGTGRSGFQCFVHYRRDLYDATPAAAAKLALRREAQITRKARGKRTNNKK